MRSADGARLYLADEDHKVVRVLPLPLVDEPATGSTDAAAVPASAAPSAPPPPPPRPSASAAPPPPPPPGTIPPVVAPPTIARQEEIAMPGAPAQVVPTDGLVLATIRDPGLLLFLKETPGNKLEEDGRVEVSPDAWGLAITKDESVAIVTSAWTHTVTGVDLKTKKVLWKLDVAREPRGVVIHPDGKTAFVSHLTSADVTRIDDIGSATPKATVVSFPPAPTRTPLGAKLTGSLGYALVMDDAGNRLLAARHALGATADDTWFGNPTVDVLQVSDNKPLLAPRGAEARIRGTPAFEDQRNAVLNNNTQFPGPYYRRQFTAPASPESDIVQPRAMIVAHRSSTIWVASEGMDLVVQYPLMAAAPSAVAMRTVGVGDQYQDPKIVAEYPGHGVPGVCGAPTGLALSEDETHLFVFCRSTYDVASIRIDGKSASDPILARLAPDAMGEKGSGGRRLFYSGHDSYSSGGMGCAGCHPDGRDDGHVWHEVMNEKDPPNFLATEKLADETHEGKLGYARQTPMLAGRVGAKGPYGWHAQDETIDDRLADGFGLHRWRGSKVSAKAPLTGVRVTALVAFLREGLVPPPKLSRPLTDQEKKGKEIFESDTAQCATCHTPSTDYSNRSANPLKSPLTLPGFEEETDDRFKTPSLLFVGGTAPYFHDGRVATLAALVAQNQDRMGKTTQLNEDDRAALVAYLETL
jgi:mono/diheme cytochrome c family protein